MKRIAYPLILFAMSLWFFTVMPGSVCAQYKEKTESDKTWVVKWENAEDPQFAESSEVIERIANISAAVARPGVGQDKEKWLEQWRESPSVEYIHENRPVQTLALVPNDSFFPAQSYLKQIGMPNAWEVENGNDSITIALVDTGVDLQHKDLKNNLVEGINLLQPQLPPQDDNGHGTNVAGVIAAETNNKRGVSGILWKAKMMPIKALDSNGRGDEVKLAEAIRYAVDHGAKIIVLSVGLVVNDPILSEVVQYAEDKNILLVAATGNDEGEMVRYPAAYPTVLAVGGISENNTTEERSNYGQEIDVVAPWSVYTTALGDKYETKDGTSMAAPQAAAVCALIWRKYPQLKPFEIRNLIRQTAQDVADPRWDMRTGYGLLRADRALMIPIAADFYEKNDSWEQAKPLPINSMIGASFDGGKDRDWYYIDTPYDGTIQVNMINYTGIPVKANLFVYKDPRTNGRAYSDVFSNSLEIAVSKGRNYLQLVPASAFNSKVQYSLSAAFNIYADAFEDNDKQFKAFVLAEGNQTITGTFHQNGDQDWFEYRVTRQGTLTLNLTSDTERIDSVLLVQKKGEKAVIYDSHGTGEPEIPPPIDVRPGVYYFRISKVPPNAVMGEYRLSISFAPKFVDPNEPNDRSYQATKMNANVDYTGVIHDGKDADWFQWKVNEKSWVDQNLSGIPSDRRMTLTVLDNSLSYLTMQQNEPGQNNILWSGILDPGTYYARFTSDEPFVEQMYRLRLGIKKMIAGYKDIEDHWAVDAIVNLTGKGIVNGYGDYFFMPDSPITRAEAAAVLSRTLSLADADATDYSDLDVEHWAYNYIVQVTQTGLMSGYPNGTFAPDRALSRMEMVQLMANIMGVGKEEGNSGFIDVPNRYWGAGTLKRMKEEKIIDGYENGTFHPDQAATRAELVAILDKVMKRKKE